MQKFKKNFTTKFAKDDPTDDSREYLFVPSEDDDQKRGSDVFLDDNT